ncbi:MAG: 23S rRNA (adenine(2503)-C(2))-methyltransferase RlmN, partial [Arthrobacter sp.]
MTSPKTSPAALNVPGDKPQVRPATEGWEQAKEPDGRPLLQFKSPRVSQPPEHLADLTLAQRQEKLKSLGLPAFR